MARTIELTFATTYFVLWHIFGHILQKNSYVLSEFPKLPKKSVADTTILFLTKMKETYLRNSKQQNKTNVEYLFLAQTESM